MIQETYREIEITLLEEENKWRFTANGRERKSETLPKAREAIDRALDAIATKKEKPFERVPVYFMPPYPDTSDVDAVDTGYITSVADPNHRGEPVVWVAMKHRGREKKDLNYFCAASPTNDAVIDRLKAFAKQIEAIDQQFRTEATKIERVTLPKIE